MKPSFDPQLWIDFSSSDELSRWSPANDVVMGGVSSSQIQSTANGTALFAGTVSLESGGGFASVRSNDASHDLRESRALILRVRGDGKRYQLRLRTTGASDGVSYLAPFGTEPNRWLEVTLRPDAFRPSWRGQILATAPALDMTAVRSLGFLIADQQAGSFALELAWIAKG
ncbi:MAG: hypothetical protein ACI8QZ_001236 [Chlamydiales bacterium]|jgi:hypothetical protein